MFLIVKKKLRRGTKLYVLYIFIIIYKTDTFSFKKKIAPILPGLLKEVFQPGC